MPQPILELPAELHLEFSKQLDMADLLNLLSTCHSLNNLRLHKALWNSAIWRLENIQMHPVPAHEPEALSPSELEKLAKRSYFLMRNLTSETPRAVRESTVEVGPLWHYCCLPGTYLVLVLTRDKPRVFACWDLSAGVCVASVSIPSNEAEACKPTDGFLEPYVKSSNEFTVGGFLRTPTQTPAQGTVRHFFAVHVTLDLWDKSNVLLNVVTSPRIPDVAHALIQTECFVGCRGMTMTVWSQFGHLVLWSMLPDAKLELLYRRSIAWPGRWASRRFLLQSPGGKIYQGMLGNPQLQPMLTELCLDGEEIQAENNHEALIPVDPFDAEYQTPNSFLPTDLFHAPQPIWPKYGILSLGFRRGPIHTLDTTVVRAWPAHPTEDGSITLGPSISCDIPQKQILIYHLGVSGRYAITLVREPPMYYSSQQQHLAVLHTSPAGDSELEPRLTCQPLDLGRETPLVGQLRWDDTLGLLVLDVQPNQTALTVFYFV
ncbi:hypothetical protein C8F01DRAFT_1121495 [Mycena amicta]|nr:hypothetical protein C8F01DRAFT_1121495 [Mycena amicta]